VFHDLGSFFMARIVVAIAIRKSVWVGNMLRFVSCAMCWLVVISSATRIHFLKVEKNTATAQRRHNALGALSVSVHNTLTDISGAFIRQLSIAPSAQFIGNLD
jgi:hypothetical protein